MTINENDIKTKFEAFFYHVNKQLQHLTSDERDELKSKMRRSCENYYKVKNKKKVEEIIDKVLKQDKG